MRNIPTLMALLTAACFLNTSSDLKGGIPAEFKSLLESATKPGKYEDETYAGIYNQETGLLFDKKTGNLAGIYGKDGWTAGSNLAPEGQVISPLWQVEIMFPSEEKPVATDSRNFSPSEILFKTGDEEAAIRLVWSEVKIGESRFPLEIEASLKAGDPEVRWKANVPNDKKNDFSIWSVSCPIIAVPAFDSDDNNRIVLPVRRGVLRTYGPKEARAGVGLPYPGPSAKFQFMAPYGDVSNRGLYYATEDGQGYSKVFHYANEPKWISVVLKAEHLPADRALPGTGFASPYEVVTAPFQGDWWTAARIYRAWWIKQEWASKGLLQDRKDLPDWIKKAPISLRFSTSKPERTVEENVSAGIAISNLLKDEKFFGIWYAPFGEKVGQSKEGLMETGHGHMLPVSQEVKVALDTMAERDIEFLAYLQSIIYNSKFPGISAEDVKQAQANAAKDRRGRIIYYGVETEESGKYAMNRGSDWWQQRMVDLALIAVKGGFRGVYLDSFGKGETENFAKLPGQSAGGGNQVIADQRRMAKRITKAMHEIDTEAVLSSEDPVEAFRDVVQVSLYALNSYKNYIPIYRTVWGDYSIGYGRNIRMSGETRDNIAEMGRLFVDGDVLGRFFCDGSAKLWNNPKERVEEKRYIQKASNILTHGIEHLRFGEYLRPLKLPVPDIEYTEAAEANKVMAPAVLNSVTRSHQDGSIAVVFTNISDAPVTFDWGTDALGLDKKPRTLYRMDEEGKMEKAPEGGASGNQSVTIDPYDILFYVLK